MAPSPPPASDEDGGPKSSASPLPPQHLTQQALTQTNPPVLRLPDEMLLEIFEHVAAFYENKPNPHKLGCSSSPTLEHPFPNDSEGPAWSIMAVRLACRRFCTLSSHLLIRSLQLDMTDSSLEILNKIATHPVFSKSVRALRVSTHEHLPPTDDDALEDAARWHNWLQYHIAELDRCVPISVGVSFPSTWARGRSVAGTCQVTEVTQVVKNTQVAADVAFIMLDTWDTWNLRSRLIDIPHQDFKRLFQDLKERIHERHQQQQKWLNNLPEFASTIAAALQRMPRANMFEVGDYNPDMFLDESGPSIQRFRRHREVLALRMQPQQGDWETIFRTVVAPVLLRPLSRLERLERETSHTGCFPYDSPVEGGGNTVLPLIDVAAQLPYLVARSSMALTHLSTRFDISHSNTTLIDDRYDTRWRYLPPHADDVLDRASALALQHIKTFTFVCDPESWHYFRGRWWDRGVILWKPPRIFYADYLNAPNLEEIRLSVKTYGADLPKPPHVEDTETFVLPFVFGYDLSAQQSWEALRVFSLKGVEIDFSDFKAILMESMRHGLLLVLEIVRLYLSFIIDETGESWEDALDFLRNTRPCKGPISICDPQGEFDVGEDETIRDYAFWAFATGR